MENINMINSLEFNDQLYIFSLSYGECETESTNSVKVVTVDDFLLEKGARVIVKFQYLNTAHNPTLNVNNTGAKPMVLYGIRPVSTDIDDTAWRSGAVIPFTYDGTSWVRDYWSNSLPEHVELGQGCATCSTLATTNAKTVTLSNYSLVTGGIVVINFKNAVAANSTLNINSQGAKAIRYKDANITDDIIKANDVATFIYGGTYYHLISIDRWQSDIDSIFTTLTTKSSVGHGHKYAGSATDGGPATSADKLNTDAGSETQPIFFKNGIPVATTYSLDLAGTNFGIVKSGGDVTISDGIITVNDDSHAHSNYAKEVKTTGSGNAVTAISQSGNTITATKGSTFLTAHPNISTSSDTNSEVSPLHGGTFTAVDSITRDGNGHVTKVNTKTIKLPGDNNTDTKVTQTVTTGDAEYPILAAAAASKTDTSTDTSRFATGITINPSKGRITANSLSIGGVAEMKHSTYAYINMIDASTNKVASYLTGDMAQRRMWMVHAPSDDSGFYEGFSPPPASTGLTAHRWHTILTTKDTVTVAQGGTGKTTAKDAANMFINALSTGSSTPTDDDYYVSQYVGGGTTTTTYHRRPVIALWNYIKSKITGGISNVITNNFTSNRAIVSNSDGKLSSSDVTSTELGYLDGVTSSIQTQLNGKALSADHNIKTYTSLSQLDLADSDFGNTAAAAITNISKIFEKLPNNSKLTYTNSSSNGNLVTSFKLHAATSDGGSIDMNTGYALINIEKTSSNKCMVELKSYHNEYRSYRCNLYYTDSTYKLSKWVYMMTSNNTITAVWG